MELIQQANSGDLDGVKTSIPPSADVNLENCCALTLYLESQEGRYCTTSVSVGAGPLIVAVKYSHYKCVELLLEHHASVNCTNTEGESPMSAAVRMRHYSIILLLLQHGATPPESLGDAALQLLKHAGAEHAKTVEALIDQNIINLTSERVFLAAFRFAFTRGSVELAERLLSNDSYSKIDQLYQFAVYFSAKNNWPIVLSKVLEKRVNVNALTFGQTPLFAACDEGHETAVMLLLNSGADPNVKSESFTSFPLEAAVRRGNAAICSMLLLKGAKLVQNERGQPLLHTACGADDGWTTDKGAETIPVGPMSSVVRLLVQHGVNVNAVSSDFGDTALYRACRSQHLEIVEILLEAGADVNLTGVDAFNRRYPLIAACDAGNRELVNLLVSAGADVKCRRSNNETCLHVLINAISSTLDSQKRADGVSEVDILSIIKSLIELGADVNACSSLKETALYQASIGGHEEIVRLLIDAGAETNGLSTFSPLYAACERGWAEIVDLLLQHGADTNATSMSSLCCAAQKGYTDIVGLLLKHGADANKRDRLGKSALMHVVESSTAHRRLPPQEINPLSNDLVDFSISKSILLAGGEVTVSSGYDSLSPLHTASSAGACELETELIQHGANCSSEVSALVRARKNCRETTPEQLLINDAKRSGKTGSRPLCSSRNIRSSDESHSTPPLSRAANDSESMVGPTDVVEPWSGRKRVQ